MNAVCVVSSCRSLRQLKMVRGTKSTTAFVEFVDTTSAMLVHDTLQVRMMSLRKGKGQVQGRGMQCTLWASPPCRV